MRKIILKTLLTIVTSFTIFVSCVPATGGSSNIDIANAFVKSRVDSNPALLEGLFADDFQSLDVAISLDQYPDLYTYYNTVNWTFKAGSCQEASTTLVNCSVEYNNDWAKALGNGPYDMTFAITVEDGKITMLRPSWNRDFISDALVPFMDFVQENHPDEFSTLKGPTEHFFPRGDAAIALLKSYTAEFATVQ